jgi:hypothetical protein
MNDLQRFQRFAAVTTLLSTLPAVGAGLCLGAAANFSLTAFSNPGSLIEIGAQGANLFRWGMVLDTFGYYLLLAPLALFLWNWLRSSSPSLVTLYTLCGLGYILIGAMGAIILAAVEPPLIVQYAQVSAAQREMLLVVFNSFLNAVYLGLWNPLEAFLAGIWWVGIGGVLRRERRGLGIVTILLGLGALLDAFSQFVGLEAGFIIGVTWLVLFFFVWLIWCGIDLLREPTKTRAGSEA